MSDRPSCVDSGYAFLAEIVRKSCRSGYHVREHTVSCCPSPVTWFLVPWSRYWTISPACKHTFPLEIEKCFVGWHAKAMQVPCFSSKCPPRVPGTYSDGRKSVTFQLQSTLNAVGVTIVLEDLSFLFYWLIYRSVCLLTDLLSVWTDKFLFSVS